MSQHHTIIDKDCQLDEKNCIFMINSMRDDLVKIREEQKDLFNLHRDVLKSNYELNHQLKEFVQSTNFRFEKVESEQDNFQFHIQELKTTVSETKETLMRIKNGWTGFVFVISTIISVLTAIAISFTVYDKIFTITH